MPPTPATDCDVSESLRAAQATQAPPGAPTNVEAMAAAEAEELAHPAAQRDVARATQRLAERRPELFTDVPEPPKDFKPYDGRAYDGQGHVGDSRLRQGQVVKIRDSRGGLADGGYESARGRVIGTPYLSQTHVDDDGKPVPVRAVALEQGGGIVTVPETHLEVRRPAPRVSSPNWRRRRALFPESATDEPPDFGAGARLVSDRFCDARCTARRHDFDAHRANGDPDFASPPAAPVAPTPASAPAEPAA